MAKTLIGNIKGKNGRGITSIKKTGTTGSVDTYTITYTDSTTSTFTINNSDSISLQRQIVPSAAVESSVTASQAYAAGDYVVVNGILRKVKSAIAKGDAIGNSNSTATTVTGELATLGNSVSYVVKDVTFSANQQLGSLYYGEFETEIKAKNLVLAFPLSGVRFIRPSDQSTTAKQHWMIVQTYAGSNESTKVMFCCF
nr:MAG TPA: hypothetical protein [Caudoviricetes sp.]